MQKVLVVTYYWPPGSGAGVQRWLKFSKYLPLYGWEPVIITVDPDFATYPAIDNSLNTEVPENIIVYKTKAKDYFKLYRKNKSKIPSAGFAANDEKGFLNSVIRFIRGNFFIPDPRRGWNSFAFDKSCEIIEDQKINRIITTSPPHSSQLIGLRLKKRYPSIKWIADLRDPWTDIYYYNKFYPTSISKMIDSAYEKKVLQNADNIITVGKSLKELFSLKIPGSKEKIVVIPNGFDEEDFKGLSLPKPEIFTVSYIGTLSDSYPIEGFLNALKKVKESGTDFRMRFIGVVSSERKRLIESASEIDKFEFIPYCDHVSAIRYMLESNLLVLIIPEHQSSRTIITGKIFEYLASGKPVICLGPADGDAAQILTDTGHGRTFDYHDIEGIYNYIDVLMRDSRFSEKISPSVYRRDNLAKAIVSILE